MKTDDKASRCLDAMELAEYLGVSRGHAYTLMRSNDFPSVRISERRWIVPESALEEWLKKQA